MNNLIFDEATHTYTLDGIRLPSVTEVTRFCAYDYKSDRPWLAQEAARRGTAVHEACALIDYGETPEESPEIAGYLKAYRRFLADYKPDWKLIEHPMGDLEMGFAGTLDRFGTMNPAPDIHGGLAPIILDIKTGELHNASLSAQLTGYVLLLWAEMHGFHFPPPLLLALKLSKDGTYILREAQFNRELFDACRTLHKATERKKRT